MDEQLLSELGPYREVEGANIVLDGPAISLPPQTALPFRLVIHELATNAAKYGSLSATTGLLEVKWRIEGFDGARRLALDWRESGGPAVSAPAREGFGSILIKRLLTRFPGTEIKLDYRPEGLMCSMILPLSEDRRAVSGRFGSAD